MTPYSNPHLAKKFCTVTPSTVLQPGSIVRFKNGRNGVVGDNGKVVEFANRKEMRAAIAHTRKDRKRTKSANRAQ